MAIYGQAVYGEAVYGASSDPEPPVSQQFAGGTLMKIQKLFEVMFADPQISNAELSEFTFDHLGRMKSHNASGPWAGQFAALIGATDPLYEAFKATISTEGSESALGEGLTMTKDAALKAFVELVRKRETRVKDRFGKPSPAYEEFFPRGLNEFNHVKMADAKELMDRMVLKSTKYVAQVGQEMVDEFTAARTAFMNARDTQVQQKGEVGEAAQQRRAARAALELQLQKNALTIALMFVGQPERCPDFFTQSKLENPKKAKPETPATPPPAG